MKLFRLTWLGSALLLPVALSAANADSPGSELSASSQAVVDYLVADWGTQFHSTTIPHAMENMGMPVNDDARIEIIRHLRKNIKLSRNLSYWGANNYLFTNNERRIAKLLLNAERDGRGLPSLKSAAKTIGIAKKELTAMLGFMAKAEFLEADQGSGLGFKLAQKAALWGGPLRHNFHTIHISGKDKFDVW
ncbi:MAG: hypothetical protein IID15_02880 [Candidatus Marinimicrobia bacterium]|nr:hypothetical protein [Candidatus Neomarinimicrobiota bacterium]